MSKEEGTVPNHSQMSVDGKSEEVSPDRLPNTSNDIAVRSINARLARYLDPEKRPLSLLPDQWIRGNRDVPVDLFAAQTFTLATVCGLVLALTIAVIVPATGSVNSLPTVIPVLSGLLAGFFGVVIYRFGSTASKASSREDEINAVLPDAIGFMYSQAEGNTNIYAVIAAMSEAEDAYGAVAKEFQSVTRRCEYFGTDLKQALHDQAEATPSSEMSRLFSDMVTFIESGGNISEFFSRENQKAFERVENRQQEQLDFVDMLSTMYVPFSTVPVLLVLIIAGISSFRPLGTTPLYLLSYVLAPLIPIAFMLIADFISPYSDEQTSLSIDRGERQVLSPSAYASSDAEEDEPATDDDKTTLRTRTGVFGGRSRASKSDEITPSSALHPASEGIVKTDSATDLAESSSAFDSVPNRERFYRIRSIFTNPLSYFTLKPQHAFIVSLPLAIAALVGAIVYGYVPAPSQEAAINAPIETTAWWVMLPAIVALAPVSFFHELGRRKRLSVRSEFPSALQKISSANETGMTLFESIREASTEQATQINEELRIIENKVALGVPVEQALVEFANAHKDSQISRTTRLLIEAQRASERVSNVLDVAISAAVSQEALREQHASETKSFVAMISLTTVIVIVAATVLSQTLVPLISGGSMGPIPGAGMDVGSSSAGLNPDVLRTVLFHISFQYAVLGGLFSGFLATGEFKSGYKFALAGMVVATVIWVVFESGLI